MSTSLINALKQRLGDTMVVTDVEQLAERRHDCSVISQLDDLQGRPAPNPLCMVQPKTTADVVKTVQLCRTHHTPLVPFGLGSGVVSGVRTNADTVLIDMGQMNRIREIDTRNLLATFEAGVRGADAEAALNKRGLILGHYPQSIDVSSVGGWVATRACGQFSTAYGSIEDVVFGLEVVLPDGTVLQTRQTPRAASGPDLKEIFLGSEGTLGIVTAVTFSVRWKPQKRASTAFYATDMDKGFELQRQIIHHGWLPPVMRQYDASEVQRLFPDHTRDNDALLLMVHEGPSGSVDAEIKECSEIAVDLKCDKAPVAAVDQWFVDRNHVPTFEEFLSQGVIVDTIEIAATWDRIGEIYRSTVESLNEVENIANASAHSSHAYRSGINLYFTFAAIPSDPGTMADVYYDCWRRVMEATLAGGGGISHHHGIGRIRRPWLEKELGETGLRLLRQIKEAVDPLNLMNPGVLLPDP